MMGAEDDAETAPKTKAAVTAASMARSREAAVLTPREMARRLGVDERTYRLMEAGIEPILPAQATAFKEAMANLSSERSGKPSGRRRAIRTPPTAEAAPTPEERDVDLETGLEALVSERTKLVAEIADLKAALVRAKAGLGDVEKAIRGKRTEIRARKAVAGREHTWRSKGGHARSLALPPEERSRIASKAAKARWAKAGSNNR